MNLDPSLAFTALLDFWPGLTSDQSDALIAELAPAMTAANPKDRWTFAKRWIEGRRELAENGDCCSECGGHLAVSPESGCCCLVCPDCKGWVMRDEPVHDFTIMLAPPIKIAGAVVGHSDVRECRWCGHQVPAAAVTS